MTPLRLRMTNDMQIRNLSPHTQESYLLQVSQFARHFGKSPALLGPEDVRAYQVYLTNEKKLAPKSIHVTVSALRFLYRVTLGFEWDFDLIIPCPKAPKTLAVILSPEEVLHFLGCVESLKHQVILTTCYAAGLRISEAGTPKAGSHGPTADGATRRSRQGEEGPLRHALVTVAGDTDRLLARRPAEHVDVSRRYPQRADIDQRGAGRLQQGASVNGPCQARDAAFAAACLRRPSTRGRHRSSHHPALAWPSQPVHNRAISPDSHEQSLRGDQPAGAAAAPNP